MLEATELLLRSALKARIPRADLAGFAVEGDDLVVLTPAGALRVSLGAAQAALWLKTLQKPAPSLAAKLGISPQNPAFVIGNLSDAALIAALQGCTLGDAALFVAELPDQAAFEVALAVILPQPQARFWGGDAERHDAGVFRGRFARADAGCRVHRQQILCGLGAAHYHRLRSGALMADLPQPSRGFLS
ncbi:hypothetical protein [Cypionkella psychrotolerans]|uniref:hypothetical protein n=1 Tax=Cypionkella psychrotolerans TaxID=1678131 RepID=UPI0006B44C67|nr:hypothetical protein [Cypionkella psychrotolerans]